MRSDRDGAFGFAAGRQMPIRVLLVDDHRSVLERVEKLLSPEFTIVATASNGWEMLRACSGHNPDVVVADVAMHGLSGIEASKKVLENQPGMPIVMLSMHREPEVVQSALDAGAMGYVHKLTAGDDLIPAIHSALAGKRFVSESCNYPPA